MKEFAKLIIVLTVICITAGTLLAWVNALTEEPIRQAARAAKMKALQEVLPECDNEPDSTTFTFMEESKDKEKQPVAWTFYVARKDGSFVGAAVETVSDKGYGGNITIMVGINADGNVQAVEILDQKETPGLGARIKDNEFKGQFAGKSIDATTWAVKKDQGDVDEITAATISSRAVVGAIAKALEVYKQNAEAIRETRPQAPPEGTPDAAEM